MQISSTNDMIESDPIYVVQLLKMGEDGFVCVCKSDGLSACLFVKVKGHESCNDTLVSLHEYSTPLKFL